MGSNRIIPSGTTRNPASAFYRWETEGEPAAVHFHLNVVEVLEREIARAGENEIAGLLLGRFNRGNKPTFIVEDCDPTPLMTHRELSDPSFAKLVLEAMTARWQSMPEKRLTVLGFYRAATTGSSRLLKDSKTWSLVGAEAERIHLLIEPRAERPPEATLSLVDNGAVTWSWHPIPFSRPELCGVGNTPTTNVLEDDGLPTLPPHVENGSASAAVQDTSQLGPHANNIPPTSKVNLRWKMFLGLGLLFVLSAVVLGIGMRPSHGTPQFRHTSKLSQAPRRLFRSDLKAQKEGLNWRASWDRNATALSKAKNARLLITDGVFDKSVDLNVTDMRTESVVYRADSNDVALQMESLKADTTTEVRESARIVSGFTTLAPSGSTIGNICVDKDQSREAAAKTNC